MTQRTTRRAHEARPALAAQGRVRIHAVSQITGVPEPTLRAWERRYGVPRPERTAGGYRLYDARAIDQVREMRRLCESGMAAAEAGRLVRPRGATQHETGSASIDGDPYARAVAAIVEAIRRFDDAALDRQLRALMFVGPIAEVLDGVLAPAMREIGDLWHSGALSVAEEHLASQRIGVLLRDLARLSSGEEGAARMLFASFADDEHDLGLLGTAVRASTWGFRPVFLGARTPPSAVRSAVSALAPRLVGLSVTIAPPRARARELIDDYAAACGSVPWLVGGIAAPALADLVRARGGILAPDEPSALSALVERVTARR